MVHAKGPSSPLLLSFDSKCQTTNIPGLTDLSDSLRAEL